MLDVKRLSEVFIVERKNTPIHRAHPLLKLIGTVILFIAVMIGGIEVVAMAIIMAVVESAVGRILRNVVTFLWSMRIFLLVMGVLSFIFYMPQRAIAILLRVIAGGMIIACFILTTDINDLSQALESVGTPQKIVMAIQFALRMIPLVSRDATESAEALVLRGEISPSIIPRGITTMLALVIASAIERSQYLAESLEAKYFGVTKKRTYIREIKITKYSVLQLIAKTIIMILTLPIPIPTTLL